MKLQSFTGLDLRNIVLIGYMGSGKSSIASCINKLTGMKTFEMDALIEEREHMTVSEMFSKFGEQYFRDKETALLDELTGLDNVVVSCGGGTPLREENRRILKNAGVVVWLKADANTIFNRIKNANDRPLLNGNMSVDYIKDMMESRKDKYEACAGFCIDTDGLSPDEIAKMILEKVEAESGN